MNKFKFIQSLIENKSFSESQKQKFIELTARELQKSSDLDEVLQREINIIKQKIGINLVDEVSPEQQLSTPLNKEVKSSEIYNKLKELADHKNSVKEGTSSLDSNLPKVHLPRYVNPKKTREFLIAFNQDPILKTTCHLIDNEETIELINKESQKREYRLKDHYSLILQRYHRLKKGFLLDPNISSAFLVYLTGKDYRSAYSTWSTDRIKINWGTEEIQKWAGENKGIIPNPGLNVKRSQQNDGYLFKPFSSRITGKRIRNLSELVIHFKHLFHIRGDNSLLKIIDNINEAKQWKTFIDFNIYRTNFDKSDFPENIELFIDVDNFRKAYSKIIQLAISESLNDQEIEIDLKLKREQDSVVLSICHSNSIFFKKSVDDLINRVGETHTWIIKHLNGVCDIELNADFGYNKYFSINLWNGKKMRINQLPYFKGVEHKLIF